MPRTRLIAPLLALAATAPWIAAGPAWAGGPGGTVEDAVDISVAVGTGVFLDRLVGFRASGPTNDEASARVVAQCRSAGGLDCTSDEVTNDRLCIVSVADAGNDVVAGGAGATVDAARADAFGRAAANGIPMSPGAETVISDCH